MCVLLVPLHCVDFRMFHLAEKVRQLEDELAAIKPWDLQGEVTAKDRPLHSILEADIELPFQKAALRESAGEAPGKESGGSQNLTEDFERSIVRLIQKRVADGVFDDRKEPVPQKQIDASAKKAEEKTKASQVEAELLTSKKDRAGLTKTYEEDHKAVAKANEATQNKVKEDLDRSFGKLILALDQLCDFQSCSSAAYSGDLKQGRSKRLRDAQGSSFAEDVVPFTSSM